MTDKTNDQLAEALENAGILYRHVKCTKFWPYAVGRKPNGNAEQYFRDASEAVTAERTAWLCVKAMPHMQLKLSTYEEGWWATFTEFSPNGDEEAEPRHYHGEANEPETAICLAYVEARE
jgi:hypothetical protein